VKKTTNLAESKSPDGETLLLQEHDGEYFLKVGGVPLMSTTACSSEQLMAELACGPAGPVGRNQRVLIGGLGFGFTLRKVLELVSADSEVEVAELLQVIIDWNREHLREVNGALLDDRRVEVLKKDVFKIMQSEDRYDAILLDVDNSPDPLVQKGNGRLYQRRGLEIARAALRPRGRVVYWSAHEDPGFVRLLRKVFSKVEAIPAKAYPKAKRFTHTLFVAIK
jgi:spermidine synthase